MGRGLPSDWRPDLDAAKALEAAVDEVFGTERPAALKCTVREGRASYVLLEVGADADLLIVGSRGHGGFRGFAARLGQRRMHRTRQVSGSRRPRGPAAIA